VQLAPPPVQLRAHEPPAQPTEMWAGGCEIDFVINLELLARTVIGHAVFQTAPGVARVVDVCFAFHIEVPIGAGKPDDTASASAKPNQAVTAQRVNVDPKCALNRWSPAASSAAKSAHPRRLRFSEINRLNLIAPLNLLTFHN